MSDIKRLKSHLDDIGRRTQATGGQLQGFIGDFEKKSAQVQALISGTASGADRDIAQILDEAAKSVRKAIDALRLAGDACKKSAQGL